jgi:hypothetical protein
MFNLRFPKNLIVFEIIIKTFYEKISEPVYSELNTCAFAEGRGKKGKGREESVMLRLR